jgi:cell division protein FtsW
MLQSHKALRNDLSILLFTTLALVIIGFLFIYSASSVYALERFGSSLYFVKKQAVGLALGFIAFIIACMIPVAWLKRYCPLLFFASLGVTAFTLIPGLSHHINGSSRWINLFGFVFQPSELLKIALILYIAHFITKNEHRTSSFINGYLPPLLIIGITSLILLRQPDFGLTVTLIITIFALFFIAHFYTRYVALTIAALIPAGIALIIGKSYRLKRILTFLNPWDDPQGAGFQIIQSLIAIGSGHIMGLGISQSKQKFFYLPMQHTDFIFSIIAEETGFFGCLILITLYITFLYTGLKLAWQLSDPFSTLSTIGFVLLVNLQALINLAVTTGLVPTKGIGLPLVSYGNTALVCNLAMIGLIVRMAKEAR